MKTKLPKYAVWLLLTAAGLMLQPTWAQDQGTSPSDGGAGGGGGHKWHHKLGFLTEAERQELKTDREAVFAANPSLKSQAEALHQEGKELFQNKDASQADKQAFFEKRHEFEQTLDAALVQYDPSIQAVLDKIKQHREEWKSNHQDGDNSGSTN